MTNKKWRDFNDAEQQQGFDLIPRGTLVPVRMTLKPGGYDAPQSGWDGGYATESYETGSIFLAAEFVITAGPHANRKMWSNIGLYSEKGPVWGHMGRSFIRAALNSARHIHPKDVSPEAAAARYIEGFHELDGLRFLARVEIEKDGYGQERNVVKFALEPDHPQYAKLSDLLTQTAPRKSRSTGPSGATPAPTASAAEHATAPFVTQSSQQRATVTGNPPNAQSL